MRAARPAGSVASRVAITHVLYRLVGWIADVWLGVNDQPRLALRGEGILRVEISAEQHAGGVPWQFA